MRKNVLLAVSLLFSGLAFTSQETLQSAIGNKNTSVHAANLIIKTNEITPYSCSKSIQNCTLQIVPIGCLNPSGSILITNSSKINALNITASSANSNFLTFVVQNNSCPAALSPGMSCSISFNTNFSVAFSVPNVTVKGSNTNATFLNINAFPCAYTLSGTVSGLTANGLVLQNNGTNNLSVAAGTSTFTFTEPIITGSSYNITIAQQPTGLACSISNGSGTNVMSNITDVGISCQSGALSPIPGSPFTTTGTPSNVIISPNGLFAYAISDGTNTISAYSIDSTGALTTISGSPFATGITPEFIAISPDGQFAYVTSAADNKVSAYSIDNNGALTAISGSPFPTGASPAGIAITPDGQFAYVVNQNDGTVSAYSIDNTGALTTISGSPFSTPGTSPVFIALSANGQFAYITNQSSANVSGYSINNMGALTAIPESPFTAGTLPTGIAISPDSKFAYVAIVPDKTVLAYSIGTTGILTAISGNPVTTGNGPFAIAITPNGQFLYVANLSSNTVSGYSITNPGVLTPIPGSPFATGSEPNGIAISPNGQFVYVANANDGTISAYKIS